MSESSVFVTVGTTKFDLLIETVSQPEVLSVLEHSKYTRLLMQIGKGEYVPRVDKKSGIAVEYYTLKDSIASDIQQANLVISHAGAGSIFETLTAKRPLLVVVNELLMDNHQLELAQQLAKEGYLFYTTCSRLKDTLVDIDFSNLKPYVKGNPKVIGDYLDKQFGFK